MEQGGDLLVARVRADNGLHVAVQDGEPARVVLEYEPGVGVRRGPPVLTGGRGTKLRFPLRQRGPVALHTGRTECRRVGQDVNVEEVLAAVELEVQQPVDEPGRRWAGRGGDLRVQDEQAS